MRLVVRSECRTVAPQFQSGADRSARLDPLTGRCLSGSGAAVSEVKQALGRGELAYQLDAASDRPHR